MGLTLTRFWLLAGGTNYPVGEDPASIATLAPVGEGRLHAIARVLGARSRRALGRFRSSRYLELALAGDAPPPALPPAFIDDFRALLAACARAGVAIIPSLLSFELFQPAVVVTGGVVTRGRARFVLGERSDPDHRASHIEAFLDATLAPLLDASLDHRGAIYAWELVNEPEWAVATGPLQLDPAAYGFVPTLPLVDGSAMSDFIDRGVGRIARAGFVATVGFGDPNPEWLDPRVSSSLHTLAREGRYVHQRHHYPTLFGAHTLPPHDASPITPCLLGELPTAMGGLRPDNLRWRDAALRETERDPRRYLAARVELARERGYPVALLWAARSSDPRTRWAEDQKKQITALLAPR
jgi:hypothetical protein